MESEKKKAQREKAGVKRAGEIGSTFSGMEGWVSGILRGLDDKQRTYGTLGYQAESR